MTMKQIIQAVVDAAFADASGLIIDEATLIKPLDALQLAVTTEPKRSSYVKKIDVLRLLVSMLDSAIAQRGMPTIRVKLSDHLGVDAEATIERLKAFFVSLPRTYDTYIHLDGCQTKGIGRVELGPGLELLEVEEESPLAQLRPPNDVKWRITRALRGEPVKEWFEPRQVLLRVRSIGVCTESSDASVPSDAVAITKQFIGACVSLGFLHNAYRWMPPRYAASVLCRDVDGAHSVEVTLPQSVAWSLSRHDWTPAVTEPRGLFEQSDPEATANRLRRNLRRVASLVVRPADDSETKHLRAASEWLFESEAEQNETKAFIYCSIGIEALIESPENQTSARLGDRLAYMLGRSPSERRSLISEFTAFYRHRSTVIHGRERRLTDEARRLLHWGQQTLRRGIASDVSKVSIDD